MNEKQPPQPLPSSQGTGPDPKELAEAGQGERKGEWQGYDLTLLTAFFED